MIGQEIQFMNPLGRVNTITVTATNVFKLYKELQSDGWEILRPKRARVHMSESLCTACES